MGAEPISLTTALIIAGASAAVSGGTAITSTVLQNRAQQEAADAQSALARQQARQLMTVAQQKAQIERGKKINEGNLVRSRLRVAAGESGIGYGGTFEALMRQIDFDASSNVAIVEQNLSNRLSSIRLGEASQLASLTAIPDSPILAGLSSGVQGFSTGLSIASAAGSLQGADNPAPEAPFHIRRVE